MRLPRRAAAATSVVLALALGGTATASSSGGPAPQPGVPARPQPGPSILHAPLADAPQLQNRPGSGWRAAPLLVSGGQAYVGGEFLSQGYLYDDHGGAGVSDPSDQYLSHFTFGAKAGTLTYPTDKAFVNNAADLVELRVRPTADSTALRVTVNSLVDPARTAFTVAIGSSPAPVAWPDLAGVSSPAVLFLTVHGTTARLIRAGSGQAVSPAPTVQVDTTRKQYDVRVPHAAWDPGSARVRLAAGVGLWDVDAGHYLVPAAQATASAPGGQSPSGEALFDLAFRRTEPTPDWSRMGLSATLVDAAVVEQADQHCFWRDCAQAAALRTGDVSAFFADVDFGALQRGITDLTAVPRTGSVDRIMASHFSFAPGGVDGSKSCGRFPVTCHGMFLGNLQPYNIYVPAKPPPAAGWGVTLQLHASGGNYNEYMGSRNQSELALRGAGSVTITTLSRDSSGDYTDAAEADVFEAWADAATRYRLDGSRTAVSGYSMGGGGTYKLLERWPDLFARGFGAAALPYDGGFQGQWIRSMRNVPLLVWISAGDEGSPSFYQLEQINALEAQGMPFAFTQFAEGDHVTLATNDEYGPAADWLGDSRVHANPARITYAVDPANDFPATGVVADHAYWLSALTLRSRKTPAPSAVDTATGQVVSALDPGALTSGPAALVDAHSYAVGESAPAVLTPASTPGVVAGGYHGPMPYLQTEQAAAPVRPVAREDRLTLTATNLATAVVDTAGARLSCRATVTVTSDGPLRVTFPACHRTLTFRAGTATARL
jgi:dienelactone hydrolase